MLEVKNVTKVYGGGKNAFKALDDVSINFGSRGLVVVLGKSGCGKSTLLNIVGGLDSPTKGEVVINGRSTKSFKRSDFDAYRNTFVGIVFQEFNLIDEISVFDNINMTMKLQEKSADVNTVDEALAMVGLANLGYRKPSELSGGQRQRVALARALLKKPEIILADEPTGALDSVTSEEVFETLKRIAQSKLVVVVTHNRELAHAYADRIVEIVDGKIVGDRVRETTADDGVKELEGGVIEIGAGGKVTAQQLNARLKKGEINYIGLSHEKDRIALAYPETVDGFYESQDSAAYKNTEPSDITADNKEFKLSKGGLTFKDSLKLAREGTKRAKKRYRFLTVIMTVCFSMFSLALIIGMVNLPSVAAKSAFDSGAQPVVAVGYIVKDSLSLTKLDDKKIERLRGEMGEGGVCASLVYTSPIFADYTEDNYYQTSNWDGFYQEDSYYYGSDSSGFSFDCFNNVIDCNDITEFGLKTVAGKTACSDMSEIIISDFAAYVMTRRGIVGYDKDGKYGIIYPETVADVVGCRIELGETEKFYTVVGLFETDYEHYKSIIGASTLDPNVQKLSDTLRGNRAFFYRTMIGKVGFGAELASQKKNGGQLLNYYFTLSTNGSESYMRHEINNSDLTYDRENFERNMYWSATGVNHDEAPVSLGENEIVVTLDVIKNMLDLYDVEDSGIKNNAKFLALMNGTCDFSLYRRWDNLIGSEKQVKIAGIMYDNYPREFYMSENMIEEYMSGTTSYDLMYFPKGGTRSGLESKFSSLKKDGFVFGTATAHIEDLREFDEILSTMGTVFFYIAVAMLALAFLITFNYMTASIRFRTKEIAVYRVIGAKTFDVSKIFLTEGGFIVVKTTIAAIIISFLLSLLLNNIMGGILSAFGLSVTLINFNWLIEPIVILLGSALTVFLSSIIPIMRVCGKKPVEAVKLI
ncbi:MAG: ABC transporter ATP-binding protein/permease [Clostridia bacterium]|nr:ABC transporter ATP-binding protein/permease [Clostridia bacterium]